MSATAARTPTTEARPGRLVEQLETTRSGMRRLHWVSGMVWTALAVVGLGSLVVGADWWWVLDTTVRGAGLLAMLVVAAVVFERRALRPIREFGRTEAAEEVEATFPDLGQRVRTTLEYVEPTPETALAAPALVRALEHDTEHRTRHIDFIDLVPWRTLRRPVLGLAALAILSLYAMVRDPEIRIAAGRLFLLPIPYTTLDVKPGGQIVKEGSDLTVEAIISGRPVNRVVLQYRRMGGRGDWTTVALGNTEDARGSARLGTLSSTIKDLREGHEYRVIAGPIESPTFPIQVVHALLVKRREATIEPPSYTRKPSSKTTEGDFTVIEGSAVRFQIALDRPATRASLSVTEAPAPGKPDSRPTLDVPLDIQGATLTSVLARVDRPVVYEVRARAGDGMELEPLKSKIRVQADEKPSITFVKPPESIAVIATAEIPMQVEARDDFGVARVGIVYQVGDGPKQTLRLDDLKDQPLSARLLATLALEDFKLDFNSGITYYAFVEDNHSSPPHRTTTDLRYIDIIPFEQSFQMKEGGGNCSGNCLSLEELIARQRQNLGRTFTHVEDASVDRETAGRLATAEKSLTETTADFTQALEARFGPQPPLREALAAMRDATGLLERPDFPTALSAEEKALAGLIKARKNLRKLLSDKNSATACRAIDMRQNLKIRRLPTKPSDDRKEQLARDLKALAREERQIGAACQGGSNSSPDPGQDPSKAPSLSDRQQRAAETARQLQKTMGADEAMTRLARDRMERAAENVQKGAEALQQARMDQAAEKTGTAAGQLEQLAEQVEGLRAKEIAAKLARARDLAQKLAREEKGMSDQLAKRAEPGQAAAQRTLAGGAETLADWLKRFQTDASDESRELSQAIGKAGRANPPGEIAEGMRQAADAIDSGRSGPASAARETRQAADRLAALARDLDAARRAFVQPQLDELVAAEKQAARTQQTLRSVQDDAQKARAEKAVSDLLSTMEALKARTGNTPVGQATNTLAENLQNPRGGWGRVVRKEGPPILQPPVGYSDGVKQVLIALQAEIQEIVLRDALTDRDEAVPPQYKALVEDYYRVLSEDLR